MRTMRPSLITKSTPGLALPAGVPAFACLLLTGFPWGSVGVSRAEELPRPSAITNATANASRETVPKAKPIPNAAINYAEFRRLVVELAPIRESRRLTEEQFLAKAAATKAEADTGTGRHAKAVVLDARSADKYALRHVKGAVSLPFTDFTEESLAQVIPTKATPVLIYCNNNFGGAPRAFAGKAAPAALNISTFIALTAYGYTNVYELGPLVEVAQSKLSFEGSEVEGGE